MARLKSNEPVKNKRIYLRMTELEEKEIKNLCEEFEISTPSHFLRRAKNRYVKFLLKELEKTK